MKLPPLRALQCFEAVVRHHSFSIAANELNISQSAVSHQIKQLENFLGESLFIRLGRTFETTHKGARFYAQVHDSLTQISRASQELQRKNTGKIRMAVYSSQAIRWLIPKLENFTVQYPEINLVFNMVTDDPQLIDSVADCFITLKPPKRDFTSQFLYSEKQTLVCGQRVWEGIKNKPLLEVLNSTPLLSVNYRENSKDDHVDWLEWAKQAKVQLPTTARFQYFSHVLLASEAARFNLGIALVDEVIIDNAELQSNLVRLNAPQCITGADFYFTYKKSRSNNLAYQKIGHWLKMQCKF